MTPTASPPDTFHPAGGRTPVFVLVTALAVVTLQLATGWRYGLFRDELYYLACASHLDWGYVDHPPLSIIALAGVRGLLGDSLLVILTKNYGEAGAIDYYGRGYRLPSAISAHNNYYFWGPGRDPSVVIAVGWSTGDLARSFARVEVAGRVESPYAMPFETRWPIHVCRGLKLPLDAAWRQAKMFI
jgi:hypothetical protein